MPTTKCVIPADFYEVANSLPIEIKELVQEAINRAFRYGRYPEEKYDTCYYAARDTAFYLIGKKILGMEQQINSERAQKRNLQ